MMKLCLMTDSLGSLDFPRMVSTAAKLGFEALEIATGNWSRAPHLKLDEMLSSPAARSEFLDTIASEGLHVDSLNCSGNPLAPDSSGKQHEEVTLKTFKLAELLGIQKIIMMSGLPGGQPGDRTPNWITTSWPPRNCDILAWQWEEVTIPFWKKLVLIAQAHGIEKIALENHGCQMVYNVRTLKKLREKVGPMIGMNLDPSHMFWMGGDPRIMARELGDMIYHVHAKDVRIETGMTGADGLLDTRTIDEYADRSWNYVAVGHGHDVSWWKEFFSIISMTGYDGPVSLEMEDRTMDQITGTEKSIEVVKQALPRIFP